ncbi:MAG: phosphoribosyltransferase [Dictyoglomaceae bacterium]
MEYISPNWNEIYNLCLELAKKIKEDNYSPEVIVGIARGGWIPARILSDLLENSYTANIKIDFYRGIGETRERPVITQTISTGVEGKRVLVADDVADSGKSLKVAKEHLEHCGANQVKIATIFYKPWSIIKPDYYIKETSAWIIFPWEVNETLLKIFKGLTAQRKSKEEIYQELIKTGVEKGLLDRLMKEFWGNI